MNEKKEFKISLGTFTILIISMILLGLVAGTILYIKIGNIDIAKTTIENNKKAFNYSITRKFTGRF